MQQSNPYSDVLKIQKQELQAKNGFQLIKKTNYTKYH